MYLTMYLSKKSDYMLLIDWVRKTERPLTVAGTAHKAYLILQ